MGVLDPEIELRNNVALLGGEAIPPHRLDVVLGDTLAGGVYDPEIELRAGVALLGGEAIPPHRLDVVLGDTLAVGRT